MTKKIHEAKLEVLQMSSGSDVPDGCSSASLALIERSQELHTIIKKEAFKISDREAQSYRNLLDGFIASVNEILIDTTKKQYHLLSVLTSQELAGTIVEQVTYLSTESMQMNFGPPYFVGDDVATNYSTVWVFHPYVSKGFFVENYTTPGAMMQFSYTKEKEWNFSFQETSTPTAIYRIDNGSNTALYTKLGGTEVYLVPKDNHRIVGVASKRSKEVYVWKIQSVKDQVKREYPIKPRK